MEESSADQETEIWHLKPQNLGLWVDELPGVDELIPYGNHVGRQITGSTEKKQKNNTYCDSISSYWVHTDAQKSQKGFVTIPDAGSTSMSIMCVYIYIYFCTYLYEHTINASQILGRSMFETNFKTKYIQNKFESGFQHN